MVKRKVDNSLYHFLLGAVSNALPLEFAIRASEARHPELLMRLKELDSDIRTYLLELGAIPEEIDAENLIDYAWDFLQIGLPRVRSHGRVLRSEIYRIQQRCVREIRSKIVIQDRDFALPAARYFRICDLLKGNDIEKLLIASEGCLHVAKAFGRKDAIDFSAFNPVRTLRQPAHLHPSIEFGVDYCQAGQRRLFFAMNVDSAIDAFELDRQIDEFLYQVALARQGQISLIPDSLSNALLQRILSREVAGELSDEGVARINGIAAVLAGLYCRDLNKRSGLKLSEARQATLKIYKNSEDAVEKNYKRVNASIKRYTEKFEIGAVEQLGASSQKG